MQLEIQRVYPKPRLWDGQYGPSAAVKVLFTDGSEGDYLTKPDKAESIIAQLTELVGKEGEFEVEERPDYNGVKQWKLKSWPGKPQAGQGGGGGRQFTPAWANTEEGEKFVQERTDRRTSVMQAIAFGHQDLDTALACADIIYEWLRKPVSDAPKAAEPIQTRSNGQNDSQQATDGEKPASEEHSPRKAFFALWKDKNLPRSDEYSRFVIRQILVAAKKWPADQPLKSREDLGEQAWAICYAGLSTYVNKLVAAGIKPMEEAGFQREGAEA